MNKRSLIKYSLAISASSFIPGKIIHADESIQNTMKKQNMTLDSIPITPNERKERIKKAQNLMQQHNIEALIIEAGSSLIYFTGVKWRRSERFTGVVIPKEGELSFVTPYFEEPSIRESMGIDTDAAQLVRGLIAAEGPLWLGLVAATASGELSPRSADLAMRR